MALDLDNTIQLKLYETRDILRMQSIAPGTYTVPFHSEGNSLLSTLFIKSMDPGSTIKVNYWDNGAGNGDLPGERVDLESHPLINAVDAPLSDRITVTALHNKPRFEIIVSGGNVEASLYITVVATFAANINASLKFQEQMADLSKDKGLIVAGYDANQNKIIFLPIENGAVKVSGSISVGSMTNGKIYSKNIATQNVEDSYTFPVAIQKFKFKARQSVKLLYAWDAGDIALGNYLTISAGAGYESEQFTAATKTIYFQSPVASLDIEIEAWT